MKQETLEEASMNWDYLSFEAGAKWQQENSYSKEEVSKMIIMAREICSVHGSIGLDNDSLQWNLELFSMKYTVNQIFEQFKKK